MKRALLVFVILSLIFSNINYVDATVAPSPYAMADYSDQSGSVDLATGDMSLSLPVMSVPGVDGGLSYDISLGYSSGINVDQSASVVGVGWGLNIPTVSRSVGGVPDDYNEGQVVNTYIYDMASDSVFYRHYEKRVGWVSHWVNVGFELAKSVGQILAAQTAPTPDKMPPLEGVQKIRDPWALLNAGKTLMSAGNAPIYYREVITEAEFNSIGSNHGINGFMYLDGYYPQGDNFLMEVNNPDSFFVSSPMYSGSITYPTYGGFHRAHTSSEAYLCMVPTSSSGKILQKDTFELVQSGEDYCDNPLSIRFILDDDLVVAGEITDAPLFNKVEMVDSSGIKYIFEASSIIKSSKIMKTKFPEPASLTPDCSKLFANKKDYNYLEMEFKKPYVNVWSLSRIESTRNSEDYVEFIYSPWKETKTTWPISDNELIETCGYNPDGTISKSISEVYTRDVEAIQTKTHRAVFNNLDNGLGVQVVSGSLPKKVENITLWYLGDNQNWDGGSIDDISLQNFDFVYSSSANSLNVGPLGKGLTLESVQSCGLDGECMPETSFEYSYNPTYNFQNNWYNRDRWGYFCDSCTDGYSWHNHRGIETDQSDAWSLTKINWPSGGSTEWVYEDDRYSYIGDKYIGENFYFFPGYSGVDRFGGGPRVKNVINCDGLNSCYSTLYEYENGAIAGEPGPYSSNKFMDTTLGISGSSVVIYGNVYVTPEGDNGYVENRFTNAIDYPDKGYYGGGIRLAYQDPVGNNYVAGIDVPAAAHKETLLPSGYGNSIALQAPANAGEGNPDVWEIVYFGGVIQDAQDMPPSYTYYCSNTIDFAEGEDCNIFGSNDPAKCKSLGLGECEFHFVPIAESNHSHKWFRTPEGPDGTCTPHGTHWNIAGNDIDNRNQCPFITMESSSQMFQSDFVFHWGTLDGSEEPLYKYFSDIPVNHFDPGDVDDELDQFLSKILADTPFCTNAYPTHSNGVICELKAAFSELGCSNNFRGAGFCDVLKLNDSSGYGGFSFDKFRGLKESEHVYNSEGDMIAYTEYDYGIDGEFNIGDKNSILGYVTEDYNIMFDSVDPTYLANAHSLPYSAWITLRGKTEGLDGKEISETYEYAQNGLVNFVNTSNYNSDGVFEKLISTTNYVESTTCIDGADSYALVGGELPGLGKEYHIWNYVSDSQVISQISGVTEAVSASKDTLDSSNKCYSDASYVWREDNTNPGFVDPSEFKTYVSKVMERGGIYDRSVLVEDALGNDVRSHYSVSAGNACSGDTNGPRLTCVEDTNRNQIEYYYDEYGRLSRTIDSNGVEVYYGYDDLHRLKNVTDSVSGAEIDYIYNYGTKECGSLGYDGINGDNCMNWVQTNTKIDDSTTMKSRSYVDGLGRHIQSSVKKDDTHAISVDTSYNERGLVDTITVPYERDLNILLKLFEITKIVDTDDYLLGFNAADHEDKSSGSNNVKYIYYDDPLARVSKEFPLSVFDQWNGIDDCGHASGICTQFNYYPVYSTAIQQSPSVVQKDVVYSDEQPRFAQTTFDPDCEGSDCGVFALPIEPEVLKLGQLDCDGNLRGECVGSIVPPNDQLVCGRRDLGCGGTNPVCQVESGYPLCGISNDYVACYCKGDGVCHGDAGENYMNSPSDCDPPSPAWYIGDGQCDYYYGETYVQSPDDCLGDGYCDLNGGETHMNSPDCQFKYTFNEIYDAEGNFVRSKIDMFGNVIEITNSYGDKSKFKYDALGRLVDSEDFEGRSANYGALHDIEYNVLGQVVKEYDLNMDGWVEYEYDDVGNMISLTRAVGTDEEQTNLFVYDDLYRLTRTCIDSNADGVCQDYELLSQSYYDVYSDGTSCRPGSSVGFLCEVKNYKDGEGFVKYLYDLKGNMIEVTSTIGSNQYTTSYDYDDIGNVKRIDISNGDYIEYKYNLMNQLKEVSINGDVSKFDFNYVPEGMLDYVVYPDNSVQDYSYNNRNWIESILVNNVPGVGLAFNENYPVYDNVGNLEEIRNEIDGTSATFVYDKLYRLDSFSNVGNYYDESTIGFMDLLNVDYDYDKVGNRIDRLITGNGNDIINSVSDYSYGDDDQLDFADGCNYEYNAIGAVTKKRCGLDPATLYKYNNNDQLSIVYTSDYDLFFTYDSLGRRVVKSKLDETTGEMSHTAYVYGADSNPLVVIEPYDYPGFGDCIGDLNDDGFVDNTDTILYASSCASGSPDLNLCDFNLDGSYSWVDHLCFEGNTNTNFITCSRTC